MKLSNSCGWEIFPHPPFIPDLVPKMKKHLKCQCFYFIEDVQNQVPGLYIKKKRNAGITYSILAASPSKQCPW
jgi:hypothetical protein